MCNLTRAQTLAQAGDTLWLHSSGGTFTPFSWTKSGNADNGGKITLRAATASPQVAWSGASVLGSYITLKGLAFSGGFTVDTLYNELRKSVRRLLVEDCSFSDSVVIWRADSSMFRRLTADTLVKFRLLGGYKTADTTYGDEGGWAVADTLRQCSFRTKSINAYNQVELAHTRHCVIDSSRWYQVAYHSGASPIKIFNSRNLHAYDSFWDLHNNAPTFDDEAGYFVLRDHTISPYFLRDTFYFRGPHPNSKLITYYGSYGSSRHIKMEHCLIRNDVNVGIWLNRNPEQDTLRYNVIVGRPWRGMGGSHDTRGIGGVYLASDAGGTALFEHNTVASATGGAFGWHDDFNPSNLVVLRHNVFYTDTDSTASSGCVTRAFYPYWGTQRSNTSTYVSQDNNLFWTKLSSSGGDKSIYYYHSGSGTCKLSVPGTTGSWYTDSGNLFDGSSRHGSPRFTDSTAAGFNPALQCGSFASWPTWPNGYVGAVADKCAPGAVSNLTAAVGFECDEIAVTWTAPGDDAGALGTAQLYDLRWSTSAINSANFGSATPITLSAPKAAGGSESHTHVVGECSGTIYYAVKSRDSNGNWSAISNLPSASTPCPPPDCDPMRSAGLARDENEPQRTDLSAPRKPQNGDVLIRFAIARPEAGKSLDVSIHDIAGRRVRRLSEGVARVGRYEESWRPSQPGVYFVRLRVGDGAMSRTIICVR